jgi:thiol-disulfide isomerase/thioredoxin
MMFGLFSRSLVGKLAPNITGDTWFNNTAFPTVTQQQIKAHQPISLTEHLPGYVTLIQFWDYECMNCIHAIPHVRELWDKYRDKKFIIIGVHTPEFDYAKDPENVLQAVLQFNISYPVVSDAQYVTWEAYNTKAWPRFLIIDQQGIITYDHTGEGGYEQMEQVISKLLQ